MPGNLTRTTPAAVIVSSSSSDCAIGERDMERDMRTKEVEV